MEDSNPPFQRMESLRIAFSASLEDRTEIVHGELNREIKRKLKLYSGRKDDSVLKFELIRMCLINKKFAIIFDPGL